MAASSGMGGGIPFLSSRFFVFSSGFWSSGLFRDPGCLPTNVHVQSAATTGSTTPPDLTAARLQHFVRAVAERRPSPFVLAAIVPRCRQARQALFGTSRHITQSHPRGTDRGTLISANQR
jgi:hypothetical protein